MNSSDITFSTHRLDYDVSTPFAAVTVSIPLGRSVFIGICDHFSRSMFVRLDTDVGRAGLSRSLPSDSSFVEAV